MATIETPQYTDTSLEKISDYEYKREMGSYKPHFEGIPETYYPLNRKEICAAVTILIFVILAALGIMIGFIFWAERGGLEEYVIVWVTIGLVFLVLMIILFYLGGKKRIRLEKDMIADSNRRQQEMIRNKK